MIRPFFLPVALMVALSACGQTSSNRSSVRAMATVQADIPSITLQWQAFANTTGFTIFRREAGATTWGSALATLPGSALQYVDASVTAGVGYEYRIVRNAGGSGYGYVRSGIEVPPVEFRGKLLLLVESGVAAELPAQLSSLADDLLADGWLVVRHDVDPSASPAEVRALIIAEHAAAPDLVKSVYLIGHVPVPYSGNHAPDGHSYHSGAWACDGYYAELNGNWTDATVNTNASNHLWNHNVPGDGKLDQNDFPGAVELQVGRVDLSRLDVFPQTEAELLNDYLGKAHAWKVGAFTVPATAAIWDNLEWVGNPLASSGFMSASPCVGPSSVTELVAAEGSFAQHYLNNDDLFTFHGSTGLLGTGTNGTTFTGTENGLSCTDLLNNTRGGVFNLSIGSYFGDWDNPDNFLRASLAKGNSLAHVWSGMPNWFLHPMAIGEPIGYCALRTMNNSNADYSLQNGGWQGQSMGQAHMALMGDPTIRMRYTAPPTGLVATNENWFARFNWSPSPEAVDGYNIYRIDSENDTIIRLNETLVQDTFFLSNALFVPGGRYMVRAQKLVTTPSGSYHDLSLGALAVGLGEQVADCLGTIGGANIPGAPCDDGDPLTTNEVYDADCQCFDPTIGVDELGLDGTTLWPRPAADEVYVRSLFAQGEVLVRALDGSVLRRLPTASTTLVLDVRALPTGTYFLEVRDRRSVRRVERLVVVH